MDTEVKSLSEIKAMEGRDLDSAVNADTLISGEKADGTFGVFKFFTGIKSFFKGVSALGTLASGSKVLVTDDNGNISYTTPSQIKSGMNLVDTTSLNGALANLSTTKIASNPSTTTSLGNINDGGFGYIVSGAGAISPSDYEILNVSAIDCADSIICLPYVIGSNQKWACHIVNASDMTAYANKSVKLMVTYKKLT